MAGRALTGSSRDYSTDRAKRELAILLERYSLANQGDIEEFVGASTVPQVSGVSMTSNLKTVTVKWEAVRIQDVSHYVVQIDSSEAFSNPTEFVATQPQFIYMDGDPATTYYARVKVLTTLGDSGAYSITVSNATDQVATADIADGAIDKAQIAPDATYQYTTSSASPAQSVTTSYAAITGSQLSATITSTRDNVRYSCLIQVTADLVAAPAGTNAGNENLIYVKVQRGSGASPSSWTDVYTIGPIHVATDGSAPGIAANFPETLTAGVWTYRLAIEWTNLDNVSDTLVVDAITTSLESWLA